MKKKPIKNQVGKKGGGRAGSGRFTASAGGLPINKINNKLIKENNNRRIFVGGDVRKVMCGRNARRRTADKETPRILTRLGASGPGADLSCQRQRVRSGP